MSAVLSLKMAYRRFRATLGRLALSVIAVALGVGLVVAFRLMNVAVMHAFLDATDAIAGRASLTVRSGEGLTFADDIIQTVAALPGVKLAAPLVRSVTFPDDGSGELLTIHGVDLTHEASVRVYHSTENSNEVIDDLIAFLNQPDSIILGREFAERRGLQKGKSIQLVTPTGVRSFTIRGLLEAQGLARILGGRLVVMDLYAAQEAFTAKGQINQIDLMISHDQDVDRVKKAVAAVLPGGLTVEEPASRRELIRKTIGAFQTMLTAFSFLSVFAGFVICYSRLGTVFESKAWEVGLLRAVGLRQGTVFLELLKESLLLAAAGIVLGATLGTLIGYYGLPYLANTTAIAFRLPLPSVEGSLNADAFLLGGLVGLFAALAAATIPALRLTQAQPVAALTMRGREAPVDDSPVRWGLRTLLLVLIAASVGLQRVAESTLLGHVTSGLIGLAICAFATPLVTYGGRVLLAVWQPLFGATGRLAAQRLGQRRRRASLTVATLGVGLAVVFLFGTLAWSFEGTLVSILSRSLGADLIISSAFVSGAYWSAPVSEHLLAELSAVPGIAIAAGEQSKEIEYAHDVIFLKTYDPVSFRDARVYRWPLDESLPTKPLELVGIGEAVMVTRAFSYRYGLHAGDAIALDSPTGTVEFPVAAVSGVPVENAVIMSRAVYSKHWNDPMISLAHVVLEDHADIGVVRAAIARQLGSKYRLSIRSRAELIDYFADQVRRAFSLSYLMEAIVFFLVLVGIGDTLAASVIESTREFGTMRAVGISRTQLFSLVMLEGTAIGLLGLFLAGVAGLALGVFWVDMQFPAILGWKLDVHLPAMFAFGAAILTLLLCLAGSLLPSLHAARLEPAAALRYE